MFAGKQRLAALLFALPLIAAPALPASAVPVGADEWERIFFGKQTPEQLDGTILALDLAGPTPGAVIRLGSGPITYIANGDTLMANGTRLTADDINAEHILFSDQGGVMYGIAVQSAPSGTAPETDIRPARGGYFGNGRSGTSTSAIAARNSMFSLSQVPAEKVTMLVENAGVPAQFAHLVATNIEPARSRGGRPGWRVKAVPTLLQRFGVNLLTDDIILTVDGIPVQQLDAVRQHILSRVDGQVFEVELQRGGKLIMVEFQE